jgi:hypothetical protein
LQQRLPSLFQASLHQFAPMWTATADVVAEATLSQPQNMLDLASGAAPGRALAAASDQGMRVAFRIAEMRRGARATPVLREGSAPYPGRKQICRHPDHDVLCLEHEVWGQERLGAVPLLRCVLRGGERVEAEPSLAQSRQHRATQLQAFPAAVRDVERPATWPVRASDALSEMTVAATG